MINDAKANIVAADKDPVAAAKNSAPASFDYLQTIRSPADQGVSSAGTFSQVFTNASAIGGYVSSLLSGPKVGNQFFEDTGGKCKTPSGRTVNRWTWNNNKMGAEDAADVLGPSFANAVAGGGLDGIIPGAAGDVAAMNPLKIANALVLSGVPDCKAFSCPVTDPLTGLDKGSETQFLTPSLELNMRGCTEVAEPPAPPAEKFTQMFRSPLDDSPLDDATPFFRSAYSPRKLINTDSTPYVLLGMAVVALVALKIMS